DAGGRGPGWSGNSYEGVECQRGAAGKYAGSLDEIIYSLQEAAGGGGYKWAGVDSKGRVIRSRELVYLSGRPKLLQIDDPAAQRANAYAEALRAAGIAPGGGAGAFAGMGAGAFFGGGGHASPAA